MKRIVTISMVALLALTGASAALAGDTTDTKMDVESAQGVVAAVDGTSVTVEVEGDDGATTEMTFGTDEKTKVIKDGARVEFDELTAGDEVSVTYMSADGKHTAIAIGIG